MVSLRLIRTIDTCDPRYSKKKTNDGCTSVSSEKVELATIANKNEMPVDRTTILPATQQQQLELSSDQPQTAHSLTENAGSQSPTLFELDTNLSSDIRE